MNKQLTVVINSKIAEVNLNSLVDNLSVRSYTSGIKIFFSFIRANQIKNPTRETVIAFKQALTETGKKPATVALYLAAVKRFFAWCEQSGFYTNIAREVKAPKIDKGHKKDCFAGAQIKSILVGINRSSLEGKRNFAMFALMAACGLRTIELARADIGDLRNVGGVSVLFIQGKGKTSKADFVKLPAQVENAIRDYLQARGRYLYLTHDGITAKDSQHAQFQESPKKQ